MLIDIERYIEKYAQSGLPLAELYLLRQVPQLHQLFFNTLLLVASVARGGGRIQPIIRVHHYLIYINTSLINIIFLDI